MGENVDLFSFTKEKMSLEMKDISSYSPLVLAYIGDAIYELIIRTKVVTESNAQVNKLHQRTASLVKAEAQAKIIKLIKDELSEEEASVYRRGKNSKPHSTAKNASINDYSHATGMEALMGYLYLTGRSDRMEELIMLGISRLDLENGETD